MAEECSINEYAVRGAGQQTLGAMLTIHDVANHADYCCLKIGCRAAYCSTNKVVYSCLWTLMLTDISANRISSMRSSLHYSLTIPYKLMTNLYYQQDNNLS